MSINTSMPLAKSTSSSHDAANQLLHVSAYAYLARLCDYMYDVYSADYSAIYMLDRTLYRETGFDVIYHVCRNDGDYVVTEDVIASMLERGNDYIINDVGNIFIDQSNSVLLTDKMMFIYVINDSSSNAIGIYVMIKDTGPDNCLSDHVFSSQQYRMSSEIENILLKKKLEKQLEAYNSLLELSNDCLIELDTNFIIENISLSSMQIYGYSFDQMIGMNIISFIPDVFSEDVIDNLHNLMMSNDPNEVVADYIITDDNSRILSYKFKLQKDENNNCTGMVCGVSDITDSVMASASMNKNSEIFSEILSRLPVVFFKMDKDGTLVDIRGNGLSRMGVEDMDWVGKPGYGLFIGMDRLIDLSLSGETVSFESKGTYKGQPWWFLVSMFFDGWSGSGTLGFAVDITDQKNGELKLVELLTQNRELAQKLIVVQEEERRSLSRELHDELGQSITAVKSLARAITASSGDAYSESRSLGNSIIDISGRLYEVVNNIMQRLRPDVLDSLGFEATINCCIAHSHLEQTGVNCTVDYIGDLDNLDEIIQITIYRIVQECLTNIAKHAMASNVSVLIERRVASYLDRRSVITGQINAQGPVNQIERDTLLIRIIDDGVGMDVSRADKPKRKSGGKGLLGMKERVMAIGGMLNIESSNNNGVHIEAILDLKTTIKSGYNKALRSSMSELKDSLGV